MEPASRAAAGTVSATSSGKASPSPLPLSLRQGLIFETKASVLPYCAGHSPQTISGKNVLPSSTIAPPPVDATVDVDGRGVWNATSRPATATR